jgi:hypothetical protein
MIIAFIQLGVLYAGCKEWIIYETFPANRGLTYRAELVGAVTQSTHGNIDLSQQRFNIYDGFIFDCHGPSLPKSLHETRLSSDVGPGFNVQ